MPLATGLARLIGFILQKKSRLDSHGKDSGVVILSNKPYKDGPGGSGQYTFKIYHIGSKIPGLLTSSRLFSLIGWQSPAELRGFSSHIVESHCHRDSLPCHLPGAEHLTAFVIFCTEGSQFI